MITLNLHKEIYSEAWVRAVAASIGFCATKPNGPDVDSVDLTLHAYGPRGTTRSPKLDLQLKCTAQAIPAQDFPFKLSVKNYNDLRATDLQVSRLLIVVLVPDDPANWASHSSAELALRQSGYWADLRGEPPTTNTDSITITMPVVQEFSPRLLDKLMMPRAQGGVL
ncbi:MAG: DUF4365 domain-containing protein [Myxococcales bacterium]|nr:DUF4365 domain-containing protein [Myxococcales bacterium]